MAKRANDVRKNLETEGKAGSRLWQLLGLGSQKGILSAFLTEKSAAKKGSKKRTAGSKVLAALAPHISVDCVIFGYDAEELRVLLTVKKNTPVKVLAKRSVALPGDVVKAEEDFDESAKRISRQITGIDNIFLEQLRAMGYHGQPQKKTDIGWLPLKPAEPGVRIIKVAYFAIINLNDAGRQPDTVDPSLKWYPVKKIPKLAEGNNETLQKALETLRFKLKHFPLLFELLPEKFTLGEAQALYEAISGKKLDKRNFRRKLNGQNLLSPLNEKQKDVAHKPAQLYRFNFKAYEKLVDTTSPFPVF